jgi:hypothetical protein
VQTKQNSRKRLADEHDRSATTCRRRATCTRCHGNSYFFDGVTKPTSHHQCFKGVA